MKKYLAEPHAALRANFRDALSRIPQVARRVLPLLATKQTAIAAGSLAALVFIGCYTGYQIHQFCHSSACLEVDHTPVAMVSAEKAPPAKRWAGAANLLVPEPANTEVPLAAEALFTACRAALFEPAKAQQADGHARVWRRGSEIQPPPEPSADVVSSQEQFISFEQPLPEAHEIANCHTGQCDVSAAEACDVPRARWLGTAIRWESDIEVAKARAEAEGKGLFVICISGNFEDPGFT